MKKILEMCNGCSACALNCPVQAIEMKENDKGFLQAYINEKLCVNCNQCEYICNSSKIALYDITKSEHYVAVSKDRKILKKSSSGGLGYIFAKSYIDFGKKGCGVSYNRKTDNAEHIIYTDEELLHQTQGSKYLQSNNINAFREALLYNDDMIIFGTPCQIAGFRQVIKNKKDKEHFLLIDIFCHGVPSTKLWRNHINQIRTKKNIQDEIFPEFRENKNFFLKFSNYFHWYNQDAFMMLFLSGNCLNMACYSCPYRRTSSADIRIGDLMSPKYKSLWYSPSCVCVNSENGKNFYNSLSDKIESYHIDFSEIDNIQEDICKKNIKEINSNFLLLSKDDITPEMIVGRKIFFNRLKSLVKIPYIKILKNFMKDDLYNIVNKGL